MSDDSIPIEEALLQAKILLDHRFLEDLVEKLELKPVVERLVRDHLESTRYHFSSCFGDRERQQPSVALVDKAAPAGSL